MSRIRSRWHRWGGKTFMGDGLIQFLVIAVFVIVSLMDGAARKRRKQAQSLGHLPEPDGLSEWADDQDQAAESSEGMVPEDLWQEIAALARGEVPGRGVDPLHGPETSDPWTSDPETSDLETRDLATSEVDPAVDAWTGPEQAIPPSTPSSDLQAGYLHPDQAVTHREHAQVITSPARPLPEELPHEFVPHSPEQPSEPQKEPRRVPKPGGLLSGVRLGAGRSLRDAIIVAEVLSPPVVLRDSDWKPVF